MTELQAVVLTITFLCKLCHFGEQAQERQPKRHKMIEKQRDGDRERKREINTETERDRDRDRKRESARPIREKGDGKQSCECSQGSKHTQLTEQM